MYVIYFNYWLFPLLTQQELVCSLADLRWTAVIILCEERQVHKTQDLKKYTDTISLDLSQPHQIFASRFIYISGKLTLHTRAH